MAAGGMSATLGSDLAQRTATALILLVVAGLAVWAGGVAFAALIAVAGLVVAWEIDRMGAPAARPKRLLMAALWIAPAEAAAWLLRDTGLTALIFPIAIVIAADIGAYAAGRTFGGPKLAPRLSPSKTWSGLAGGLLGGLATGGALFASGLAPAAFAGPVAAASAALIVAATSVAGDLAESHLKRKAGVKDSGRLLPGHGGVFDRIDGLLMALPVFGLILWAMGGPA